MTYLPILSSLNHFFGPLSELPCDCVNTHTVLISINLLALEQLRTVIAVCKDSSAES